MTKLKFITLLTVLLTGFTNAQHILHIDKSLRTPLMRAFSVLKTAGVTLNYEEQTFIVTYGETRNKAVAVARGKDREGVYIHINRDRWSDYSELTKVWIILHELGHDYFNLEHDDTNMNIMNTAIPPALTSKLWRKAKEDFTNKLKQLQ